MEPSEYSLASSRRSVSSGTQRRTAREKKLMQKARREEAKERLWANLTKGHSRYTVFGQTEWYE